jgi:hypothetical protein
MPLARQRRARVGPAGRLRARARVRHDVVRTWTSDPKRRPHTHRWARLPQLQVNAVCGPHADVRRDVALLRRSGLWAGGDPAGHLGALGPQPARARRRGRPHNRDDTRGRARRRRGLRGRRPSRSRSRRRRGSGPRSRHRRRFGPGRHRRYGRDRRREEEQRVEVSLRIGDTADAEVDVWDGKLRDSARPHRADHVALGHVHAAGDPQRAKVEQRRGVSVGGRDRKGLAAGRHGARKGDRPARRSDDRGSRCRTDVDAAMESALVRVGAEAERAQDRPLHRPRPGVRCGGGAKSRDRRADPQAPEARPDLLPALQTTATVPGRPVVVKSAYSEPR